MENNEVKKEVNQENAPVQEKETLKQKIVRKKEEIKAKRAEKKAANADKPAIGKKIAAGVGIAALVVGGVLAGVAAKNRTGSDEVYDPDEGCEPGDDCFEAEESTEETPEEVVEE